MPDFSSYSYFIKNDQAMQTYVILFSVLLLLMGVSDVRCLPAAIDPNDCELHSPISMHEFCCDIHDENTEFLECQIEWNDKIHPTTEEHEKNQNFCVSECIYNKTDYLGKDRKSLRMNVIRHHLEELHGDEESEQQLYSTYEECAAHAKGMLENDAVKKLGAELSNHDCHPYPGLVFECVSHQLILNCPPKKFHKTAQCEHARKYLKACLKQ